MILLVLSDTPYKLFFNALWIWKQIYLTNFVTLISKWNLKKGFHNSIVLIIQT